MSKPRAEHWQCMKWLLQYLKVLGMGLQYGTLQKLNFERYSPRDSDVASHPDKLEEHGWLCVFVLWRTN